MAVIGEASVKITGDLKPLLDSMAAAKKVVEQFDAAMKKTSSNTTKLFSKLQNQRVKIDYSAVTKMNQAFDNAQRRMEKINKTKISPQVDIPKMSWFQNLPDEVNRANRSVSEFGSNFTKVFAAIGTYMGVREIQRYADSWTQMGNEIAAAQQVAGRQARSLQELNELANQSRSGIESTVNLYARLMRATASVAKNEQEVAQATDTVNKAFKAGGAAATEQAAGILQLSQALGSGFLQGDELRSIRENAPLLAQAIAKEFKTTIAGLKQLGSEGKLTTDRVFRAILNAQQNIDAIYEKTSATIADGLTRVQNALTQYIGEADQSTGATAVINKALTSLADNMNTVADVGFKFAAAMAGIFIGRTVSSIVSSIGLMGAELVRFTNSLRAASAVAGSSAIAWGSLGAALGPLTAIIGGLAGVALTSYIASGASAEHQTEMLRKEMEQLGIVSAKTAEEIDKTTESVDKMSDASKVRKIAQIKDEIDKITDGWALLGTEDNFSVVINAATNAARNFWASAADKQGANEIKNAVEQFKNFEITAEEAQKKLKEIRDTNVSQPIVDISDKAETLITQVNDLRTYLASMGEVPGLAEVNNQFDSLINNVQGFQAQGFLSQEQADSLEEAIKKIRTTGEVTDETRKTIESLSGVSPNLGGFFRTLDIAIGKLQTVTAYVNSLKTVNVGPIGEQMGPSIDLFTQAKAAEDYVAQQTKAYGLNDKDYKLAKLREQIRKEAIKDEIKLTEEQVNQLANARLQGDIDRQEERRSASKARREKEKAPKKPKLNDYEKEVRSFEERIALMQAEQQIMEQFNPVVNDYGFGLAKAEAAQKLLSDAKRAGLEVSKEQLTLEQLLAGEFDKLSPKAREQAESIYFLSDSYAAATANGQKLKETNAEIEGQWETIREASRSAMSGFVSDMVQGKSAAEALQNALGKLADALMKIGLEILFGKPGSGGFGVLGSLFGSWATGGYTGEGGKYQPAGVVHKGEYVMSKEATKNLGVGNLDALHSIGKSGRGFASGGFAGNRINVPNSSLSRKSGSIGGNSQKVAVDVGVRNFVDDDGNWRAAVQEISYNVSTDVTRSGISEFNSMLPDRMQEIQTNPRRRARV